MSAQFQLTVWRHAKKALAAGDFDALEQFGFTREMVDLLQQSNDEQLQALAREMPTLFTIQFDLKAAQLAMTWRREHPDASQSEFDAFLDGVLAAKQPELVD